jgi:hypothetical protein
LGAFATSATTAAEATTSGATVSASVAVVAATVVGGDVVVVVDEVVVAAPTSVAAAGVFVVLSSLLMLWARTLCKGLAPVAAAAKPAAATTRVPENAHVTIIRLRGVSIVNLLIARYRQLTRSW